KRGGGRCPSGKDRLPLGEWRLSPFSAHRRKVANVSNNKPFESEIIDGDILAIFLNGALDAASTPEFDKAIQAHLYAGCPKIIMDCRNMPYISSLGMGSLIVLQTKLKRRGGEVKLSTVFGTAMEIMRVVGMDKVLGIYGDLEFARQSFYPKGQAPHRP